MKSASAPASAAPSAGAGKSAAPKAGGASANPFARQTAKRSLTRMSAGRRRTR